MTDRGYELTGFAAAEAVTALMALGNRGLRFNRARVMLALASRRGRVHLAACLRLPARCKAVSRVWAVVPVRRAPRRARVRSRASGRVATASRPAGGR